MNKFYIKFSLLLFFICVLSGSLLGQSHIESLTHPTTTTSDDGVIVASGEYGSYQVRVKLNSSAYEDSPFLFTKLTAGDYTLIYEYYKNKGQGWKTYATQKVTLVAGGLNLNYCSSYGDTGDVVITSVVFDEYTYTSSSNSYYADNTSKVMNVEAGSSHSLSVKVSSWHNGANVKAWIDWNHDGDFSDSGETFDLGSVDKLSKDKQTSNSHLSIEIPVDAKVGNARMRISVKQDGEPTSCEKRFNGEVEDYTLNVTSNSSPTIDTDGDGIIDSDDLDDDNDGILDIDEYRQVEADPFSVVNGNSEIFYLPSASDGFTIDITSLDNSFNMIINGVKLVSGELQFQKNVNADTDSFVRFESDNAAYGDSGVSQVYNLNTSHDASIISVQITIDAAGGISFKGIRKPTSDLENLIIDSSDPQFNTITWNATGTNTVQISQKIEGPTYLYATGSGISRINDTDNDGIADSKDTDSDNDGCPDATEGANSLITTATLTGGSNGGSSNNLGTVSNNNGIPLPLGTKNGTETTGQDRVAAVAISETVTIEPITASQELPICEGTDIIFTANASGFRVTDFGSTELTTDDTTEVLDSDGTATSKDTSDDLIYNWYLNSSTVSIATTRTLPLSAVTNAMNGNEYRVEVSGPNISGCPVEESVTLTVNPIPKPIGIFFNE